MKLKNIFLKTCMILFLSCGIFNINFAMNSELLENFNTQHDISIQSDLNTQLIHKISDYAHKPQDLINDIDKIVPFITDAYNKHSENSEENFKHTLITYTKSNTSLAITTTKQHFSTISLIKDLIKKIAEFYNHADTYPEYQAYFLTSQKKRDDDKINYFIRQLVTKWEEQATEKFSKIEKNAKESIQYLISTAANGELKTNITSIINDKDLFTKKFNAKYVALVIRLYTITQIKEVPNAGATNNSAQIPQFLFNNTNEKEAIKDLRNIIKNYEIEKKRFKTYTYAGIGGTILGITLTTLLYNNVNETTEFQFAKYNKNKCEKDLCSWTSKNCTSSNEKGDVQTPFKTIENFCKETFLNTTKKTKKPYRTTQVIQKFNKRNSHFINKYNCSYH